MNEDVVNHANYDPEIFLKDMVLYGEIIKESGDQGKTDEFVNNLLDIYYNKNLKATFDSVVIRGIDPMPVDNVEMMMIFEDTICQKIKEKPEEAKSILMQYPDLGKILSYESFLSEVIGDLPENMQERLKDREYIGKYEIQEEILGNSFPSEDDITPEKLDKLGNIAKFYIVSNKYSEMVAMGDSEKAEAFWNGLYKSDRSMTEEEFREYIDQIKDLPEFREIDNFIHLSENPRGDTLPDKVVDYLKYNHPKPDSDKMFDPDFDHFYEFFENYRRKEYHPVYNDEGFLDLKKTSFLVQPPMYAKSTGWFTDGFFLLPDGSNVLSKFPLSMKATRSGVADKNCIYCPIIASGIAKTIGVSASENTLARWRDGMSRILSKNFLNSGEELITFYSNPSDSRIQKTSEVFEILDESLSLRHYPKAEVEQAKLEFLKQEFLAKMIGLMDQKSENTGIIISGDSTDRHVRLAPAYDFDYSFFIGENTNLPLRVADNGQADIGSFIKQYKDYPGFIDFVNRSMVSLDMKKVYQNIYGDTGIKIFEHPEGNETLTRFSGYVEQNIAKAKQTLRAIQPEERGEK